MTLGKVSVAIEAQMASFESDMGRAARIAEKNFKKIEADAKRTEAQMKAFGKTIGVAIAAGATIAAVAIKKAIDNADQLRDLSIRIGVGTEALSAYAYAAKQTGTDIDGLSIGLKTLAKNAAEALDAGSSKGKLFEALGVNVKDAQGNLKQMDVLLPEVADKFKQLEDGTLKATLAQELFGKSGLELTEFLNQGSKGLADYTARARELGIVISKDTADAADEFNDQLADLKTAADGLAAQVAAELLPRLIVLVKEMNNFVADGGNAIRIADGIGKAFDVAAGAWDIFARQTQIVNAALNTMIGLLASATVLVEGLIKKDFSKIGAGISGGIDSVRAGYGMATAQIGSKPKKILNGADFSNVTSSVQGRKSTEQALLEYYQNLAATRSTPRAAGGRAGKSKEMPDFAKKAADDLARLVEVEARARSQFEALAAQLAGPMAEAAYRYSVEQENLNTLAKEGAIDSQALSAAQANLAAEYKVTTERLDRQLNPYKDVNAAIEEEIMLLGMSTAAQEIYNNLKAAGVDANSNFGLSVIENTKQLQLAREAAAYMDDFKDGLSDAFTDFASGAKSAKEAFGDFADDLFATALRFVADKAIRSLFDSFANMGSGTPAGETESGIGGLISLFGGPRAAGGPVSSSRFYEVGENNRPEILRSRGKSYLIPGNNGAVMPMRGGGGVAQTNHFHYAAPYDARTESQKNARLAFETSRAAARSK
jgi:DNA-binding protein YbaB